MASPSKWPGGTVTNIGPTREQTKYWEKHNHRVRAFVAVRGNYSFVGKITGKRIPCTSKYMPHQGEREVARRLRKQGVI